MADISDVNSAQSIKIIGADATGVEQTPVQSTSSGGLHFNLRDNAGTEIATAANPLKVDGNVASGATDTGNPVKIGGVFNTTLPTVTDGQRVDQQLSANGELLTKEQNNHRRITGAATTVIKSGAGYLRRVVISGPANSTITLYDNTAGSGTIIAVINSSNGGDPTYLEYGINFSIGLTVVTTGAGSNYNVLYS